MIVLIITEIRDALKLLELIRIILRNHTKLKKYRTRYSTENMFSLKILGSPN